MSIDLDQISSTAIFLWDPDLDFSCSRSLNIFTLYITCRSILVDHFKFCCHFCDLDFVHSNFKVIQYLRLTTAFKLVLSQSSQILLPLCNPTLLSLAVSCSTLLILEIVGDSILSQIYTKIKFSSIKSVLQLSLVYLAFFEHILMGTNAQVCNVSKKYSTRNVVLGRF